ncbi:MAG: PspC domain-containing protein [Nitrososphaerota archaeon]
MNLSSLKALERSSRDRVLAGVFGGLGEYFNVDPNILRLVGVALALLAPIPIISLYCVAAIIIPRKDGVSSLSPHVDIPRLFPLAAGLVLFIIGVGIIGVGPWEWFVWSLSSISKLFTSLFGLLMAIIGLAILVGELRRI